MKIRFAGKFYDVRAISRGRTEIYCLTEVGWVSVDLDTVGLLP